MPTPSKLSTLTSSDRLSPTAPWSSLSSASLVMWSSPSKLISAYCVFGNPTKSRLLFYSIKLKNVYLWNTLINGYVKNGSYGEPFGLFVELCYGNFLPDDYTLASLAKVSGEMGDLIAGKLVHGKSIRVGFVFDVVVSNSLMSMYCKCDKFGDGRMVFDEMPLRNVGSWNVLIAGYVGCKKQSFDMEMWEIFKCMQIDEAKPDAFTISSLLPLCGGDNTKWDYGKELHCYVLRNELDFNLGSNVHLGCCLIDMYLKSNRIVLGRRVFDRIRCRNVYTWTAITNGYAHNAAYEEALSLFCEMKDGIEPNRVSLLSRGDNLSHDTTTRLEHDTNLAG